MARENDSLVEELRQQLLGDKDGNKSCIITNIPMSKDPDDPIRKVVDEVLGDFVEIETPNGSFFFPLHILRS